MKSVMVVYGKNLYTNKYMRIYKWLFASLIKQSNIIGDLDNNMRILGECGNKL